uniref:Uncharacterized protein n=1 Tax=Romanomermis culicivorax TaxID=13658 RepID=A0A915K9P3_ROMCU
MLKKLLFSKKFGLTQNFINPGERGMILCCFLMDLMERKIFLGLREVLNRVWEVYLQMGMTLALIARIDQNERKLATISTKLD